MTVCLGSLLATVFSLQLHLLPVISSYQLPCWYFFAPRRSPTNNNNPIPLHPPQHPTSCSSPACAEPRTRLAKPLTARAQSASRNATADEPSMPYMHEPEKSSACNGPTAVPYRRSWHISLDGAFTIEPESAERSSHHVGCSTFCFLVQNTVPRYIIISLSRLTTLPRTPT